MFAEVHQVINDDVKDNDDDNDADDFDDVDDVGSSPNLNFMIVVIFIFLAIKKYINYQHF